METTQQRNGADEGWPWNCTRCGRTVYHDVLVCEECDRSARPADPGSLRTLVHELLAWMRRQSYAQFVAVVATVAGAELLLTVLWIKVLFSGALPL